MAVIDDIFKSRSGTGGTSIVGAPVTFNGQGTLTVTPFLPYTLATVTFNGQATVSAVGTSDNIISGSITFNGQATLSLTGTQVLSSDAVVFFLGSSDLILNPEAYTPPPQRVSYLDVTLDYQTFLQVRIGGPTMTKTGQLVAVWSGDSHLLIYTVRDKDGNLVDLDNSGISEIIWNLANDVNSPTLISKSLTLGGIVKLNQSNFPGMYQVTIEPTDTFILNGKFYFETKLFASNIVLQMDVGTAVIHPSQITRSLTILP